MRSFFSSSLDKIDPPSPYVNALNWDTYRSQFRAEQSGLSGNRNCVLALGSLNPDSLELSSRPNRQNVQLITQNTLANRFTIQQTPGGETLSARDVDACFTDGLADFLHETNLRDQTNLQSKTQVQSSQADRVGPATSWLETQESEDGSSYDQELEMLESVQEIAIALSRTTPRRTTAANLQ